jgi:hypothetical protein
MSHAHRKVERRGCPRYVVFRDCWVMVKGAETKVTLLNISKNGVATLGPQTTATPGEHISVRIEGITPTLNAIVVHVDYGRIGAKFDLADEAAAWEEEYPGLIEGLKPLV